MEMFCISLMSINILAVMSVTYYWGKLDKGHVDSYIISHNWKWIYNYLKKKEKNKQQEENAYCYHKKTEVEAKKKACALANWKLFIIIIIQINYVPSSLSIRGGNRP